MTTLPTKFSILHVLTMTLLIVCIGMLAGCGGSGDDAPTSTACDSASTSPAAAVPSVSAQAVTMDDMFVEVGERVPSFAGFYYDDQGRPTLLMLDPSQADAAAQAIRDIFGQDYIRGSDINVVQAKGYSFAQLQQWYDKVWTHVLEIPGAVSTDIDEMNDRLSFGAQTDDAEAAITAYLKQMCLPDGSYEVKHEEPPVPI
jgi:hypothetical protein